MTQASYRVPQRSAYPDAAYIFCAKASPDGKRLAFSNPGQHSVDIFDFDRSTGLATPVFQAPTNGNRARRVYGIEFSPNSLFVYFTQLTSAGGIEVIDLAGQSVSNLGRVARARLGALQLAPDGKIYAAKENRATLACIDQPDLGPASSLTDDALDATGQVIQINNDNSNLGLPTFTRMSDDCADGACETIAAEVDAALGDAAQMHHNALPACDDPDGKGQAPGIAVCTPLQMDQVQPSYHITWGDSDCDCIESDDTEVMTLTVCNPYSNVALSGFMVHRLRVTDDQGQDVPLLPDGTPSVTLVPLGPYCFGDIAPCSCVSRAFTLRNRGAKAGHYKIHLDGICFDVCIHQDAKSCFGFEICKD